MNIVKYITTNEAWDISRQEDTDFLYFYLHDTRTIHYDEIQQLNRYTAFSGVELRDNCLCIRILKSEV